jgi:hypothetical protein
MCVVMDEAEDEATAAANSGSALLQCTESDGRIVESASSGGRTSKKWPLKTYGLYCFLLEPELEFPESMKP